MPLHIPFLTPRGDFGAAVLPLARRRLDELGAFGAGSSWRSRFWLHFPTDEVRDSEPDQADERHHDGHAAYYGRNETSADYRACQLSIGPASLTGSFGQRLSAENETNRDHGEPLSCSEVKPSRKHLRFCPSAADHDPGGETPSTE